MLIVKVANATQNQQLDHDSGALEFGRGSQRQNKRFVLRDEFVSRDHLRVEELPQKRVRVKNLSGSQALTLPDGTTLASGGEADLDLPLHLEIGKTAIDFDVPYEEPIDKSALLTIEPPARRGDRSAQRPLLKALDKGPTAEQIAYWLESVIGLQRAPVGSKEFYTQTAQTLVELVNLELGMVILRPQEKWEISGFHAANDKVSSRYSRTLLDHVVKERRTFYQDADNMKIEAQSLMNVAAVVVSPIFGLSDDVVGVLYGSRTWGGLGRGKITALEAQVVQLLAAGVGDNLARTVATKTRAQFEQFFSPELVRELERDPKLLEGRNQEVTILSSDLRGFTALSERLGAETTCRIVRDIMERLTERISNQGGVIVDYAGDGILAMWNAPVAQEDHVARACKAAVAMVADMPELNAKWQETAGAALAIGVGINTGMAQVGNTGSSRRLKYGPHGMTVNFASRIQDATKQAGVPILMSGAVRDKLPSLFRSRPLGPFELKGISGGVTLHELCDDGGTLLPG